jgi:23S rRNA (cytosine1962-C5)-methyltransferase
MPYPRIVLKPGRDLSLRKGHPWLFSGAIARRDPSLAAGDVVEAVSSEGASLGVGFFSPDSDIAFRRLTADASCRVDRAFWTGRVRRAEELRTRVVPPGTDAFRLVNSEGDGFPGLVVDRYAGVYVMTIGSAGIERHRDDILDALVEAVRPVTVLEKSEGRSRGREGLPDRVGIAYGEDLPDRVDITENGLTFETDPLNGQKTGFFLDQRPNRELARASSRSLHVLNGFSYTGAFSVYAAEGGAERVVSVDVSAPACETAVRNLAKNGFSAERHPVIEGDVFQYLRETDVRFDLIVLDPPAFAKTRADVNRAGRAYKDANLQALKRLVPGGTLMTFSCSNHVDAELFAKIVLGAVRDAGRTAQVLRRLEAGADHPVLLGHPEGSYLKGLFLRVI